MTSSSALSRKVIFAPTAPLHPHIYSTGPICLGNLTASMSYCIVHGPRLGLLVLSVLSILFYVFELNGEGVADLPRRQVGGSMMTRFNSIMYLSSVYNNGY
ncbi:hypothetical protein NC653_014692 [Populus alba x Populus x berolinensis]|uniref:UBC core domain-containing protein n=1 Tax=Populus alba x Populus x berolinensis TaxID=444605 RepID=A0AAD6W4R0_9ROSI|nr:hypothetical protein NC653_014692 [Populus alba x Populus x berolinensis]